MKKLFYFTVLRLEDVLEKGNYTYLRNFEVYFDRNYIIYANSSKNRIYRVGKTVYLGVGLSRNFYVNVLLSPFIFFKIFKRVNPSVCITTDPIFSFWTTLLIRFFTTYFLYPVFFIDQCIKSQKSLFLKNKLLERMFIKLSFAFAPHINIFPLVGYDEFLAESWYTKNKIINVSRSVEEYPTVEFMKATKSKTVMPEEYGHSKALKFVTVSRLHWEKKLDEAIAVMNILIKKGINVELYIFGSGSEKSNLEKKAVLYNIQDYIIFKGAVSNEKLVPFLQHADGFLSILTGTALREAFLCGLPVFSYRNPMVEHYFEQGNIGFMTNSNTPEDLSLGILKYFNDESAQVLAKKNISNLTSIWSIENLQESLHETFDTHIK